VVLVDKYGQEMPKSNNFCSKPFFKQNLASTALAIFEIENGQLKDAQ
jgi:hypothetical protein